ncbi:oxidoreductase [Microbacterium sp. HM58-2]|nr:oxidoreductase [Microbacterium sp. HM58-2]
MTGTIMTDPVDDEGELMHAEDAAAQLCLAIVRLESVIAERGLPVSALVRLRLHTVVPDPTAELLELVSERLHDVPLTVTVETVQSAHALVPGQLVRLEATVDDTGQSTTPPIHLTESREMNPIANSALRDIECVLLPGDEGFDDACLPWNLAARQRPAAVAVPRASVDVAAVVRAAGDLGLRVMPQSTGHAASAVSGPTLDDVVLLRMHALTGVEVDPVARTARVRGGTLWQDVVAAAAPHGLTALHGSAGDVAVAGYVLGGGLSFYGRAHGLASSTVRAIEIVTADGELLRASAAEHPDLFWALRGGGGSFGAVVAVELDLLPIADVVAGMLLWDLSHGAEVARAWADWSAAAPESVTTTLRFLRLPPLPELPPFLSGRQLVIIDGAILEEDARAAELLAPLRALEPEVDTFTRIPAPGLLGVHMDPPTPTPSVSAHTMLAGLPPDAIDALLAVAGPGVQTPLMFAEIRHLGGALARPTDAALSRLDGTHTVVAVSVAPSAELVELGAEVTRAVVDALRPWSTGGHYANFTEHPVEGASLYGPEAWERLIRIRDVYDPGRTWVAAYGVGER